MSEIPTPALKRLGRRLRLGFIGGGEGSGIGATHRYAARLDGKYEIVAAMFDIDPERGRTFAESQFIPADRIYDTVDMFIERERARPDPMDVVAVLTPNHTHFAISDRLIDAGFHVLCEKPMTTTLADAEALVRKLERSEALLAVNYGYSGYPMVRQAKAMCARGDFGTINLIQSEWAFGAPHTMREDPSGHWRTKRGLVGSSAVLSQIGTHAVHMVSYVSGQKIDAISAELSTFVPGRELDDNAQISMRFSDGARGAMWSSYVAAGAWHGFKFKMFGDRGGFEWVQEDPNHLIVHTLGGERKLLTRNGVGATPEAQAASRIAAAHPEGFIEAIANLYSDFADAVAARVTGETPSADYPNQLDGLVGLQFIDAAIASSNDDGRWVTLP